MPCCIGPVGGDFDQGTRGDVQTSEREIPVGLSLVVVMVVVAYLMMMVLVHLLLMVLAVVVAVVLVLLASLVLEDVAVPLVVVRVVVRVDGHQMIEIVVLEICLIPVPIVIGRFAYYDNR